VDVLALLLQPLVDVGDEEAQLPTDMDRTRPPGQTPVVQGPYGDVEVLGELLDRDWRREARSRRASWCPCRAGVRAGTVRVRQSVRLRSRFGVEPAVGLAQYTSVRFTEQLALEGILPSIGSAGDAYDTQSTMMLNMDPETNTADRAQHERVWCPPAIDFEIASETPFNGHSCRT
jgi:hypothetical protein